MDAALARQALEQNRVALYAGVPHQATGVPHQATGVPPRAAGLARRLADTDLTGRCGLIIGNEAHGVSEHLRSAAAAVSIPTVGVESLNAAVAAGILLYEARRQRMLRP